LKGVSYTPKLCVPSGHQSGFWLGQPVLDHLPGRRQSASWPPGLAPSRPSDRVSGLMRLGKIYDPVRLKAASKRVLHYQAAS